MKYFIITFGCQMNKSDSERIATVLEGRGYKPASKENEADLIVVNMCSVRQSAVDRVYGKINQISNIKNQNDKVKCKIILTGCILPGDKRKLKNKVNLILDIKNLPNWPKIIEKDKNSLIQPWQINKSDYLKIKPKYSNRDLVFIPISNGCNNFCSYCVVPYVRGPLVCRDHKEILEKVKNAVNKGYREIWLLGQNVNSYGVPRETDAKQNTKQTQNINFAKLLRMINDIPGDFSIRFTSPHPADFTDELINTMAKCKKVAHYLNLPVQSGDNEILKKMNRNYTVEQYKNWVEKIREKIPDINLSTDVIVGFPGETKKHFENTAKLFKEIKFNLAYIAKYSPRPGTAAFRLKDNVPLKEKKRREKVLREILEKQKS